MSAPPRPWQPFWVEHSIEGEIKVGALIPKEVFDALLAVAKAAGSAQDNPAWVFEMSDALTALDAAYPDWRTW